MEYFLPVHLKRYVSRIVRAGIKVQEAALTHEDLTVVGFLLRGSKTALGNMLARSKLRVTPGAQGLVGSKLVPVLADQDINGCSSCSMSEDHELRRNVGVRDHVIETIQRASRLTSLKIHLHVERGPCFQPRLPEPGVVHIVLGASPPGAYDYLWPQYLCGVQLHHESHFVKVPAPTPGYGGVVEDAERKALAQIVKNTIYLFLPTYAERLYLLGPGTDLFAKALHYVLGRYPLKEELNPLGIRIESEEMFVDLESLRETVEQMALKREVEKTEREIRELLEQYQHQLRQLQVFKNLMLAESSHQTNANKMVQWRRLRKLAGYKEVYATKTGWRFCTIPVVHTYNGHSYALGTYCVSIDSIKGVSVWALETNHPKLVPHPHISSAGFVCLGNIGPAIQEAIAEDDFAGAFELVWRWLSTGYDPAVADAKIEEWPTI